MKIVFVTPPWTDDLGRFARIARTRNSHPHLGILYLAAVAEQRGHAVRIIDAEAERFEIDEVVREIFAESSDMVAFTVTSPVFHKAVAMARGLKEAGFSAPLLIGGEHLNVFRKDAFADCFDYGFFGECEESFDTFLRLMAEGDTSFSSVPGLIFRRSGIVVETMPAPSQDNLDSLLFPALHLLKHGRYEMTFATRERKKFLPILATRGCPFRCAFCSEPLTNPTIRFRSAGNIVDEMEHWYRLLGTSHFFFVDSNLTLNRGQITGICNEIINRRLPVTFEGWTRVNLVDRELLALMKRAGLVRMSYGVESGDENILKIIRKEITRADVENAFTMTSELGIETACFLMLGLPGDTKESVRRTIAFVRRIPGLMFSNFSIANPYPGTEMYHWAQTGQYGMHLLTDDATVSRRYDFSPVAVNDLSPEDLVRLQKVGLFMIHFTPRRILVSLKMLGLFQLLAILFALVGDLLRIRRRPVG